MINCDICGKDINTLKESWHGIPEGNDITYICDSCYKKVIDDLKSKEDYEE